MWVWVLRFTAENKVWSNVQQRLVNITPPGFWRIILSEQCKHWEKDWVPLHFPVQIRHFTITPLMPSAAEYWLLNPNFKHYNTTECSSNVMLLYIQTHLFGVHSNYYCDRPKTSDYFVDSNEKQTAEHMLFISKKGETHAQCIGVSGSYNIAPRHKRRKKQKICCGLELTCIPTGTMNIIFPAWDITVLPQISKLYFQYSV